MESFVVQLAEESGFTHSINLNGGPGPGSITSRLSTLSKASDSEAVGTPGELDVTSR
jgi:hypothetical protein